VGVDLRELRIAAGLRQQDVAEALGLQRSRFNKIERGIYPLPEDKLVPLSEALGVHLADILNSGVRVAGHVPGRSAFGTMLGSARRRANLTQEELGERAGVSVWVLGAWERGRSQPDIDGLVALAGALEIAPEGLIPTGDDDSEGHIGRRPLLLDAFERVPAEARDDALTIILGVLAGFEVSPRSTDR